MNLKKTFKSPHYRDNEEMLAFFSFYEFFRKFVKQKKRKWSGKKRLLRDGTLQKNGVVHSVVI